MTEPITLARTKSFRALANDLGSILEQIVTDPTAAAHSARELLGELHEALPRQSLAELVGGEILGLIGTIVEIRATEYLGILIGEKEKAKELPRQGLVLLCLPDQKAETITAELTDIYPRWDLPSLLPAEGIPVTTTRAGDLSATPKKASGLPTEQAANEPVGAALKDTDSASAPGSPEYVVVSEEEFYELPNKSKVRSVNLPGQEITGTRTRKGRWVLSSIGRTMNDVEAWNELSSHGYMGRVFRLVQE